MDKKSESNWADRGKKVKQDLYNLCERLPFNGSMLFSRTVNTQHQQRVQSMWKELFFLPSCNTYSSPRRGMTGVNVCALVNVLCELAINLCQAGSNGDRRRDHGNATSAVVLVVYNECQLANLQPTLPFPVDTYTSLISLTWRFRLSTSRSYSTVLQARAPPGGEGPLPLLGIVLNYCEFNAKHILIIT